MTRCFLLLILFILNFSATVFADSIHIDVPVSHEKINHKDHVSKNSSSEDSDEHCADHDCCHQNHVHYYLLPLVPVTLITISSQYSFPDYIHAFITNYSEIVKPPLV
jgi:hypothetical protein